MYLLQNVKITSYLLLPALSYLYGISVIYPNDIHFYKICLILAMAFMLYTTKLNIANVGHRIDLSILRLAQNFL